MHRKQYNLTLFEEPTEVVRKHLKATGGQSLTSWVNALIVEFAREIQGQPSPLGKKPEDMTMREFAEVMRYWWEKSHEA